jgi:hypothetical protein
VRPRTAPEYLVEFALSLAFLVVLVRVFGPVEDWAARRRRRSTFGRERVESAIGEARLPPPTSAGPDSRSDRPRVK